MSFRARQVSNPRLPDQTIADPDAAVCSTTHAIRWVPKSIGWRSADWLYSVAPTYTRDGEKWRAVFHASVHNVRALGEIRDTPALAKLDAQAEADRIAREAA